LLHGLRGSQISEVHNRPATAIQQYIPPLTLSRHGPRLKLKLHSQTKDAQMSNDSNPDHPQICEDAMRNFILLALPWLSFQQQMLDIAKKGIKDASHVKPTEKFALHELHALMMILDRSGTWRNLIDKDFEKRVENASKEVFPKVASASIQLIEAQETILKGAFEALVTLKNNNSANSTRKAADKSD
jgi:hypothetical protein